MTFILPIDWLLTRRIESSPPQLSSRVGLVSQARPFKWVKGLACETRVGYRLMATVLFMSYMPPTNLNGLMVVVMLTSTRQRWTILKL